MDREQGERDREERRPARPVALRRLQDDRDEQGGHDNLDDYPGPVVGRVGGRRGDRVVVEGDEDDERRDDRPGDLRDPVAEHVVHREAAVEEQPERDRGIEVPAGHLSERVEPHQEREAEPERDRDDPESRPAG